MDLPVVHAKDLAKLLPIEAAIDALEEAFASPRLPETPQRSHLDVGTGDLLVMPSWSDHGLGVKLVTVNQSNPATGLPLVNGVYVLFSHTTLQPLAILDAAALTGIRTSAVSGLATRHLARSDAQTLAMFGAGIQAKHHVEAMLAVRPIQRVICISRTEWRAEELLVRARAFGVEARLGHPDDVAHADIVCTCTTASKPLFDGMKLARGAHVNAVGAYRPTTRELDDTTISRGSIVVESRPAALAEAGDLLIPLRLGVIDESAIVADLAEVVAGKLVRRERDDITVFKSVGVAFEDLVVASAAYDRL